LAEQVNRSDAPTANRLRLPGHLIAKVTAGEHRLLRLGPGSWFQPTLNSSLAVPEDLGEFSAHSKWPYCWTFLLWQKLVFTKAEYQEGGLEKLQEVPFYRPVSRLEEHRELIQSELALHPVATIKQARNRIFELTGLKRGLTQVREWLGRCRLKRREVGMVPAKADPKKQAAYLAEKLEPRLQEAQAGRRLVYFVDAAHFVLQPFLGFLWCVKRVFIKAPSGRQRWNVLGALEAVSHRLITVSNESYITATSVCELLRLIAADAAGRPVTIFLDNARYQHCALVEGLALELNLELAFLPSYSPNLNLIERLWKFVKKQCLYSEYYADFAAFKTAILQCLPPAKAGIYSGRPVRTAYRRIVQH
jgi:transposase